MTTHTNIKKMAEEARLATFKMSKSSFEQRNGALKVLTENLHRDRELIFQANQLDIANAKIQGLDTALLERLSLIGRLDGIIHDIEEVIKLPDRIGELFDPRGHTQTSSFRAELVCLLIFQQKREIMFLG